LAGHSVFAVPGPSALLAAAVVSGLPVDRFFFAGFLPPKEKSRRDELKHLRSVPGSIVFYEGGSRLADTLGAIAAVFPDRTVALARELTKIHETVLRGSGKDMAAAMRDNSPPGEFVILIGPGAEAPPDESDIERALHEALKRVSLKEAVEEVSKGLGIGRKAVYNLALKLRETGQ
jgi:16S rRNA (cytidine1402-2'-O)-methyltransferase